MVKLNRQKCPVLIQTSSSKCNHDGKIIKMLFLHYRIIKQKQKNGNSLLVFLFIILSALNTFHSKEMNIFCSEMFGAPSFQHFAHSSTETSLSKSLFERFLAQSRGNNARPVEGTLKCGCAYLHTLERTYASRNNQYPFHELAIGNGSFLILIVQTV